MTAYLIDASVAARFLLVEDLSNQAESILEHFLAGDLDLKAPTLIIYELGNVLWKAVRQHIIGGEEAEKGFANFLKLKIDLIELKEEDHEAALKWSIKNQATYYDSIYVIASKKEKIPLLTADNTLSEKAHTETQTTHLRDWPSP